jgi:hypothetical protein
MPRAGLLDDPHRSSPKLRAAAAGRVASFCTARVIGADLAHRPPYVVSEFVPGPSPRRVVTRAGGWRSTGVGKYTNIGEACEWY